MLHWGVGGVAYPHPMPKRPPKVIPPRKRPKHVALVLDEVRRRSEELSKRSESMSARCGILIASAALVATLQQGREADGWLALGAVLALVSAGLGVVGIFPRKIAMPSISKTRSELYLKGTVADAQWWLVDEMAQYYAKASSYLEMRGHLLRWGFVLLGVSILTTAGSVVSDFLGGGAFMGKDLDPSQVPPIVPSQGGSSEYVEHGNNNQSETAFFGGRTEKI